MPSDAASSTASGVADPSLSDLLAEVARLQAENAALRAENAAQAAELALLRAAKGPNDSALGTGVPEAVFPPEIFLQIADFCGAGSRKLLHLASASRDLYELLLPKLYHSFSVGKTISFDRPIRDDGDTYCFRIIPPDAPYVESGLPLVKKLDASFQVSELQSERLRLLRQCINVEEVTCDVIIWKDLCYVMGELNRRTTIKKLTVEVDPNFEDPVWFPSPEPPLLPMLFQLHLAGKPTNGVFKYFDREMPHLREVHCDFTWDWRAVFEEEEQITIPTTFAAKIRSWTISESPRDFVHLYEHIPEFRPETIRDETFRTDPTGFYPLTLPWIRHLSITSIYTPWLLGGLPQTLKSLKVESLCLRITDPADLDPLAAILKQSEIKFELDGCAWSDIREMDATQLTALMKERDVWLAVPGFHWDRRGHGVEEAVEKRRKQLGI